MPRVHCIVSFLAISNVPFMVLKVLFLKGQMGFVQFEPAWPLREKRNCGSLWDLSQGQGQDKMGTAPLRVRRVC